MKLTTAILVFLIALGAMILNRKTIEAAAIEKINGVAKEVPDYVPKNYKIIWAEEFNQGTRPNPKFWNYSTYANNVLWWHNERQYYTDNVAKNARIQKGELIIEAHNEKLSELDGWAGQEFTSARLTTEGKKSFKYGFFDVRAKLTCVKGSWPAIWLLGEKPQSSWPRDGEIDIMEHVSFNPQTVYGSAHNAYSQKHGIKYTGSTNLKNPCGEYHNYQIDWRQDFIAFLVDGKEYYRFSKSVSSDGVPADYDKWPFNHNFYIILNIAVGGAWGGQQGIDPKQYPGNMAIDYIRVYQ
jgi:beta-glucanase (GH16 family)